MKKYITNIMAAVALLALVSLNYADAKEVSFNASMKCGNCAEKIQKNLGEVDGIESTNIDVASKTVTVAFNEEKIDDKSIMTKVADLGYDVSELKAKQCSTDKAAKQCSTDKASKECSTDKASKECSTTKLKKASLNEKDCGSKKDCCLDKAEAK